MAVVVRPPVAAYIKHLGSEQGNFTVENAINHLKSEQETFTVERTDSAYAKTDKSFSLNGHRSPAALCTPLSIEAVANIVKLASANDLDLGIRSGHWLPWYMSNGICIDTSGLKMFDFDATAQVVRVGAGITKAEADRFLEPYSQAVVSTTFGTTTLIGAAIEGGLGWLSGEYGLACDNILSAKIVTANGSVFECSASKNRDLFWAIKGAGSNFGVVVEATFRTVYVRNLWYSAVATYPTSSLAFITKTAAQLHKSLPATSRLSIRMETCDGRTDIKLLMVHHGDRSEANAIFAPLILNADVVKASMVPYADVAPEYTENPDHALGNRWTSAGINIAGPWINSDDLEAMATEFIHEAAEATRSSLQYAVLGIDVQDITQFNRPSVHDTAFTARHAGATCYTRLVWDDKRFDAIHEQRASDFGQKWSAKIGPQGGVPAAYPPFCAPGQLTAQNAYGANLPKLRKMKALYDPYGRFSKRMNIVPDFS